MLLSLHIENIAVIKKVDFDFSEGFMVLTGETGAGKSIVIDSINLLLGAKAERELVRTGAEKAMVSGLFGELTENVKNKLSELGVTSDEDGTILVERTLTSDGKSKITVNGRSVGLTLLKSITPLLVSIHGQSDTASLMDAHNHLELVDTYSDNDALIEKYRIAYTELEKIRREILEVKSKSAESERLREILEYQIKDIDSANLHSGEEDELVEKKVKIKNSEKITKNSEFVYRALKGSEKGSVSYLIDRSVTALSQISDVVEPFGEFSDKLREILYQIDDIAETVYDTLAEIDEDPTETLNKIESRLDRISKLKRKYGLTVDDVLAFRERAADELETIVNSDGVLKELSKKERILYKEERLVVAGNLLIGDIVWP